MKNELDNDIKKIAEGEPIPSSPSCRAVPTITAIMIIAYAVDRIWAHKSWKPLTFNSFPSFESIFGTGSTQGTHKS